MLLWWTPWRPDSEVEIEGEIGDPAYGLASAAGCHRPAGNLPVLFQNKTIVIFINQTRRKIGMVFGNPETRPVGLALKFYSSVRINLQRTPRIKIRGTR